MSLPGLKELIVAALVLAVVFGFRKGLQRRRAGRSPAPTPTPVDDGMKPREPAV